MFRKRSGRCTNAASCVTRMLLVVEVRIASSRQCRSMCSKASRLASRVSGTPSNTSSAAASAAGAPAAFTKLTRVAIACTSAASITPSSASPERLASISVCASLRSFCHASSLRGRRSIREMRWPAYANAIAMPRPIRPAPTAANLGRACPRSDCSFAIVQSLLELRRRQSGEAERFEGTRALAQVAAEETADDGQQPVRDRRVNAGIAGRGGQEGEAELGIFGDVAVRMRSMFSRQSPDFTNCLCASPYIH